MKRFMIILLSVVLLLTLASCGSKATDTQTPADTTEAEQTTGSVDTTDETKDADQTDETEESKASNQSGDPYGITFENVKLVPGTAFDAAALPEASSVTEVPSCAFEGSDNLYHYGLFELTAYDEGNGETVYSIYLLDPNTATDEGLYLGDTLSRAEELYGTDYVQNDTQVTYTAGNTMLILILQDENIISIEYRMAQ